MTCRELAAFLASYLAGELSDEARFAFDAHLAVCPDCIAYLDSYAATIALAAAAFDDREVGPGVPEELVRAIVAAREREDRRP